MRFPWSRKQGSTFPCTLCGRTVEAVPHLVAGVNGSVCSECIESAIPLLPSASVLRCARAAVYGALDKLPGSTPLADTRWLLALALARQDAESNQLRSLSAKAMRLGAGEEAVAILTRIPSADRTTADRINLAAASWLSRTFKAGLIQLDEIRDESLSLAERVLIHNNRASLLLGMNAEGERDALSKAKKELQEARTLIASIGARTGAPVGMAVTQQGGLAVPSPQRQAELLGQMLAGPDAECALAEGDHRTAERILKQVMDSSASPIVNVLLPSWGIAFRVQLLGDALWGLGNWNEARRRWQEAAAALPPDGRDAALLARRLSLRDGEQIASSPYR